MVHVDHCTEYVCAENVCRETKCADTGRLMASSAVKNIRRSRRLPGYSPALYFVLCVLILNHSSTTVAAKCEPIKAETCRDMPWNLTHMPNLVHHSSQKNAALVLSQFNDLITRQCSRYLKFFLCSMFTPMCFHNEETYPKIVPPCRKICEDARDNCEPFMLKHNVTWPEQLSCDVLPEYHRGMCITPDAFVAKPTTDEGDQFVCSAANPVVCPPAKKCKKFKVKDKSFAEKKYDFVVTAVIEKLVKTPCDAIAKVNVTSVLRRRAVEIGPGPNVLVFNGSCLCPKLKRKKEYVLSGYEKVETGELFLDKESVAEKWSRKWQKRMKKWIKMVAKPRNNRRRSTNESTAPTRKAKGEGGSRRKGGKKGRSKKNRPTKK